MSNSLLPAIEVTFVDVGNHTINDESTDDGQKWLDAFIQGATTIPGCRRCIWGTDYNNPSRVTHFIDYETARQQNMHKTNDFKGIVSPPPMHELIDPKTTDSVVILPTTADRSPFLAPDVHIVTFWGIDDAKWTELAPEWFSAIANSTACRGYIFGEIQSNPLSDMSGNSALGRGAIMISGWLSREEHDRDVAKSAVVYSYRALKEAVKKTETWGMHVVIVEDNGYMHYWRKVGSNKKPLKAVSGGLHKFGTL